MKFREHRELLEDSMKTLVELPKEEMRQWIMKKYSRNRVVGGYDVVCTAYGEWAWPDKRIDWKETWLIVADGVPVGFTDEDIN